MRFFERTAPPGKRIFAPRSRRRVDKPLMIDYNNSNHYYIIQSYFDLGADYRMMWKEKYRIGIPLVDRQHKELFDRVEQFVTALRKDGEWAEKLPEIKKTMAFMQNYVVDHFAAEEAYQKQIGYPEREQHHQIHQDFTNYVMQCAADFEKNGYPEQDVQKFAGKLLAWLINHVVATDLKMSRYVKKEGA
jgi:hemerythrin